MALARGPMRANEALVRMITSRLFGLGSRDEGGEDDTTDEWSGRMNFIKRVVKDVVQDSQEEIKAEIAALEKVRPWLWSMIWVQFLYFCLNIACNCSVFVNARPRTKRQRRGILSIAPTLITTLGLKSEAKAN